MPESQEKYDRGVEVMTKLFGRAGAPNMPEDLGTYTVEHLFGTVWADERLPIEERSLVTCAVLIALGREPEQRVHFGGAKNLGIPREKMEAMISHIAHYSGWPTAVGALRSLNEVWND